MYSLAIRDDDTCFFTQPEDLEHVYGPYWGIVPISLAVVPFSTPVHRGRSFSDNHQPHEQVPLEANPILVAYLREKIRQGQVEVMLHGYSHEYRQINGRWVGEFGWKPEQQLIRETVEGKAYLERILNTRIRVFVPPSNTISTAGIRAIRKAKLNLSGTMGRGFDRPISMNYLVAYIKRWGWRLVKGSPYPFPLSYSGHTELCAYALTPRADTESLLKALSQSMEWNAPFVLATHYWEFRDAPQMHQTLEAIIKHAKNKIHSNSTFCSVSACFGKADEIQ